MQAARRVFFKLKFIYSQDWQALSGRCGFPRRRIRRSRTVNVGVGHCKREATVLALAVTASEAN